MITPKYYNELLLHMLSIHSSEELAEQKTKEYADKFNSLDKWDHMEIDYAWHIDGFEASLNLIDKLYENA